MRSILPLRWQLLTLVSALPTVKSSWLLMTSELRKLDKTNTLMTSQKTRCLPTHPLMRPPTTRTLAVTATESGMNSAYVSKRLFLSGTSMRL
jgi:hypothetical protein